MNDRKTESDEELRQRLGAEAYEVTQRKATERALTGKYVHHDTDGTYRCVCCGAELFSSTHKYDSGSGLAELYAAACRGACAHGARSVTRHGS